MLQPSVFVAWQEWHHDLFLDQSLIAADTLYFPLNQKAANPVVARGEKLNLPGFWELSRSEDLVVIDAVANEFIKLWHEEPYHYDALRAWIWAREAEWTKILLGALEAHLTTLPKYLVPWRHQRRGRRWHGATLAPQVALAEWCQADRRVLVRLADRRDALDCVREMGLPDGPVAPRPGKRWILFSGFGVPDLMFHVQNALRDSDADLLLWPDWNEPELFATIEGLVSNAAGRIRILARPVESPCGVDLTAPPGTALLGQWLCDSRDDLASESRALESVVKEWPPTICILSDHESARTRYLLKLCDRENIPIVALPHGSWPMADPFLAIPQNTRQRCTYFAATRRGARVLAARLHKLADVSPSPWPSPRYRITPSRCARALWRCLVPRLKPVRIGIVVTTGEEIVAPDTAVSEIAESLRKLTEIPEDLGCQVAFLGRLRGSEDRPAVLCEIGAIAASRIQWEESGIRAPVHFLRDIDMLIELGNPGSMMLESFAQGIPVLRGGPDSRRRNDFMLAENLVPRLSPEDPWTNLRPFICSFGKRSVTALNQLLFLLRDAGGAHGSPYSMHMAAAER